MDISWHRAEVVVWLDLTLPVIVSRVLKRTYQRPRSRELLWGTNRERFRSLLKIWNQNESLLAWAIRQHGRRRREYAKAMRDAQWGHLRFVHLRSPEAIRRWVEDEMQQRT